MYSLLLVDDEAPILNGLYNNIDWAKSGFDNVYKASNTESALKILQSYRIDVIVTDIYMPGQNGLALCEQVRANWPLAQIIVLSGYSEFDYARRAVELGIYKYLLKPVQYAELQKQVEGALAVLESEMEEKRLLEDARQRLLEMGSIYQERCLNSWLLQGSIRPSQDAELMCNAGLPVQETMYGFPMVFQWQEQPSGDLTMQIGVQELVEKILSGAKLNWFLPLSRGSLLGCFLMPDRDKAKAFALQCENRLDVLQASVQRSTGQLLSVFAGNVTMADDMYTACSDVQRLSRWHKGEAGVLLTVERSGQGDLLFHGEELSNAVFTLDVDMLGQWLERGLSDTGDPEGDKRRRQQMMTMLLSELTGNGIGKGVGFSELQPILTPLFSPAVLGCPKEACKQKCIDAFKAYAALIQQSRDSQLHLIAARVREIIARDMEHGLNVNSIAAEMHYNSGYLSHLIKQETGQSLEQLLLTMRIDKACVYLQEGMSVQEAAMRVGYDNAAHFSRIFKQRKGVSPRSYGQL